MVKNLIPWRNSKQNKMLSIRDEMDNMVDRFISSFTFSPFESFYAGRMVPSIDVIEGKKKISVKAEMPGMEAKDIDISINGRLLTIKGERKQETKEEGDNFHRVEMAYGTYHRTIHLPADVDPASVDAAYKEGVLKIELKKTKEAETKKIDIKSG